MSYPYRCRRSICRKRVTFRKRIEHYTRTRLCPVCGHDSLSLDLAKRREAKRNVCYCDGYHFPHRKGSAPWCKHATRLPSDQDYEEKYGQR